MRNVPSGEASRMGRNSELLDDSQSEDLRAIEKRRRTVFVLFIITTTGVSMRLIFGVYFIFLLNALKNLFGPGGNNSASNLLILTIALLIFFGLLLFTGSLLMLKRRKAGFLLYTIAQLLSAGAVTWTSFSLADDILQTCIWLSLLYAAISSFWILYFRNRAYYSPRH